MYIVYIRYRALLLNGIYFGKVCQFIYLFNIYHTFMSLVKPFIDRKGDF